MGIIVGLIAISLTMAVGFLLILLWNLKNGQYDDTYSPSVRMLFEDKPKSKPENKSDHGKRSDTSKFVKKV